jgi:hypothetical protein
MKWLLLQASRSRNLEENQEGGQKIHKKNVKKIGSIRKSQEPPRPLRKLRNSKSGDFKTANFLTELETNVTKEKGVQKRIKYFNRMCLYDS